MTDSSSEPTYSWAKRVNDNKGLFESAGAIAKQALESSQQVSAAGSAGGKGPDGEDSWWFRQGAHCHYGG